MIDEKKLIEEIRKCVMSQITPDGSIPYDRDIQFYNEAIVDVLGIIEEQPKISLENKTSDKNMRGSRGVSEE